MKRGYKARETRRVNAETRQTERDKRTDEQQLEKLVKSGHGHCKEAKRLKGRIENV